MALALDAIDSGTTPDSPLYQALADTIAQNNLPIVLFHDLLRAFRQDVRKNRYADFGEVMDYCRRSANPVGRLLLHLTAQASERNLAMSDTLCSALQLVNFLQDIEQDYRENGRIYIPLDEMQRFAVSEQDIAQQHNSLQLKLLVQHQIQRTEKLLRAGSPLGKSLKGRFGLESWVGHAHWTSSPNRRICSAGRDWILQTAGVLSWVQSNRDLFKEAD